MGLERKGAYWEVTRKVELDWFSYTIGILYDRDSDAFTSVICSIISGNEWQSVFQIIHSLVFAHREKGKKELPRSIAEAIIARMENFSAFYSETELFDFLGELAPVILIDSISKIDVSKWMPDARVALANTLGRINLHSVPETEIMTLLKSLTEDELYPVRRAAYRGISRQLPVRLHALIQSWSESPILALVQRAAEAIGWAETNEDEDSQKILTDLIEKFISHPERKIREEIERAQSEHRKRIWAKEYLQKILDVQEGTNQEILQNWCFGEALSQIGDDECLDILYKHIMKVSLPNVAYWLGRIYRNLNDNWRKITLKWPDPWLDMRGTLEKGEGKFIYNHEKSVAVQYSIWYSPATTPDEKHSWGGVMTVQDMELLISFKSGQLEVSDGRRGEVVITRIQGNISVFLGNGLFPAP